MISNGRSKFRAGLIATIALQMSACGEAGEGESAPDGRLSGDWEISMTVVSGVIEREAQIRGAPVRGSVVLIPNRAGIRIQAFGGIPQQIRSP